MGHGFCGDADANSVSIGGLTALVLASSPAYLAILPPLELKPGLAQVQISCGLRTSPPFTVVFLGLELESGKTELAPGAHRTILVRVRGTAYKINLEAHNLAPDIAELQGGTITMRATSCGGVENTVRFELVGKKRGNFIVSIRLVAPLGPPRFP